MRLYRLRLHSIGLLTILRHIDSFQVCQELLSLPLKQMRDFVHRALAMTLTVRFGVIIIKFSKAKKFWKEANRPSRGN